MIKTETAYKKALEKIEEDTRFLQIQKSELIASGLPEDQVEMALQATKSFHEQLKEEVAYYERIKRGDFGLIMNLRNFGKTLIAFRIYLDLSQQELADRLGIAASQVSRDERNEYYGATLERLQEVMDAMQMEATTKIEPKNLQMAQ